MRERERGREKEVERAVGIVTYIKGGRESEREPAAELLTGV